MLQEPGLRRLVGLIGVSSRQQTDCQLRMPSHRVHVIALGTRLRTSIFSRRAKQPVVHPTRTRLDGDE
jgi:hypothetical protein